MKWGRVMKERLLRAIKQGTILQSIRCRIKIAGWIKNKRIFHDYLSSKVYYKLEKKYQTVIKQGVDETLERKKSDKVWVCWLQGIDRAPELVQACFRSLVKALPEADIICLNENTINNYITLPNYIIEKRDKGIISNAHYTDIVRTALLCKYGGGWIDATVLCTSDVFPEYIKNASLFVFQEWGGIDDLWSVISNWLIFSESNNPIMLLQLNLLYEYWKYEKTAVHYFFYHMFFTMSAKRYPEEWHKIPRYSNVPPRMMSGELGNVFTKERWKQLTTMSGIHKLNHRVSYPERRDSLYQYILNNY